MSIRITYLLPLLLIITHHGQSAKILGVFPIASISHQIVFQPIWKELSLRGHEVTILTPNPLNDPKLINLTEIDVSHTYDIMKTFGIQNLPANNAMQLMQNSYILIDMLLDAQLTHPKFLEILQNNNRTYYFDLILYENFAVSLIGLGAVFRAPIISISSLGTMMTQHDSMGNPSHPVLFPDLLTGLAGPLFGSFRDRLYSTFVAVQLRLYDYFVFLPQQDRQMRRHFGADLPYLGQLQKNISMMFLNVDPVFHSVRANVPGVVELGGFIHVKANKSLPLDLQKILDEANEGVIYISFGSNFKSVDLSNKLRQAIIQSVAELPYTFLWKWESDHMPGKPTNVITRKWLPQQDVLAHPNIKAFVTQGGLQSLQESVSRGVPLIGIPFFGDQPINVKKIIELGIGVGLDPLTITKNQLKSAIIEVAENRKYANKVREIRDVINDQPMTPLEKAVFWSEYVIRHKGAPYLRSPSIELPLYQYLFLDVIAFIASLIVLILFGIIGLVRYFKTLSKFGIKDKKNS